MTSCEVKILINFQKYEKLKKIEKQWNDFNNKQLGIEPESSVTEDEQMTKNQENVKTIVNNRNEHNNEITKTPSVNEHNTFSLKNNPLITDKLKNTAAAGHSNIINGLESGLFEQDSLDNLWLQNKRVLGKVSNLVPALLSGKAKNDEAARFISLFYSLFPEQQISQNNKKISKHVKMSAKTIPKLKRLKTN